MATQERQSKAARNQALFREVNERIREISDQYFAPAEAIGFLCECADRACIESIELTREEYDEARRIPTRFPIAVGHEEPDLERVVARNDRYEVVEKFGEAGKIAVQAWREADVPIANPS